LPTSTRPFNSVWSWSASLAGGRLGGERVLDEVAVLHDGHQGGVGPAEEGDVLQRAAVTTGGEPPPATSPANLDAPGVRARPVAARALLLVLGLTIMAIGNSAPELVITLISTVGGDRSLALGNLLGSSVFNIALILGPTVLAAPGRCRCPTTCWHWTWSSCSRPQSSASLSSSPTDD
jgi:Sodium/calcium exchanger protein